MSYSEQTFDKAYALRRFEEHMSAGALGVCLAGLLLFVSVTSNVSDVSEEVSVAQLAEQPPIAVFPDFASIDSVQVKKQQFFDFLEDYVIAENERVAATRTELLSYVEITNSGVSLSAHERTWLLQVAERYGLDSESLSEREMANELQLRVDEIPVSLALAQAANESAWGTSRFAKEGNNIFGQWCYVEGCGLIPKRRRSGATHEVRKFGSVQESVRAYINNINSHQSYRFLRDLRADMRDRNQPLDGVTLALGLGRYSARGDNYVDEVQNLILQNGLSERDAS